MKFTLKSLFLTLCLLLTGATLIASAQSKRRTRPARRARAGSVAKAATPTPAANPAASVTTATGLTYLVTQHSAAGRLPKTGDTVVVHYTGMLTNGIKFDSSRDRDETFEFTLGVGQVIKGWDEGIGKLHVGEQAILVIPPALGYGARGAGGVIPPDATLIFVVELVDIKPAQ